MSVYFVKCKASGLIKIGYSMDHETRIRGLNTAASMGVELVDVIPNGTSADEAALHKLHADCRVHGEWFRIGEGDVIAAVEQSKDRNLDRWKTIYLAGKVSHNCWRHDIVTNLRNSYDRYPGSDLEWPVLHEAVAGRFDYVGPFFAGCDHGCWHGKNSHGTGANSDGEPRGCVLERIPSNDQVYDQCTKAIDSADLVFCWLDSSAAYGTLFELGYAEAKDKTIWIGVDEKLDRSIVDDLWFAQQSASYITKASTATNALKEIMHSIGSVGAVE